ncbi:MAG: hypothetical protein M1833_004145 [Piccolia ochrophora]|nr:MAG: hypothetical protein M1833_004145 [Piccolia ochrophora]
MSSLEAHRTPPTITALIIATAILAGLGGYFLGQGSSLGLFGSSSRTPSIKYQDSEDSSDSEGEKEGQEGLSTFTQSTNDEYKLVLVVRTDLGMGKGKIAAQCSHATLACYKALQKASPDHAVLKRWERQGQAKIALQVQSEDDLDVLQAQAMSLGLCAQVVRDAGRTQIAAGSATVLGVGPGPFVGMSWFVPSFTNRRPQQREVEYDALGRTDTSPSSPIRLKGSGELKAKRRRGRSLSNLSTGRLPPQMILVG